MTQPGRILRIGGILFKSDNHQQMKAWYAQHLGPATTKYLDLSPASFMINYIVDALDPLLTRLATEGVPSHPKRQDEDYGRLARICDPDGDKIELWQSPQSQAH